MPFRGSFIHEIAKYLIPEEKTIANYKKICDNLSVERIGIFGGTFNPVHNEHVTLAKAAVKELALDRLIVMPTFCPPHKNMPSVSAEDRVNMLKLAFAGAEKIEIGDYEINRGGKSYTYLTVEHFKKETRGEIFFIVGADMLGDFKTWKEPERILAAATLAAFGRENFNADYAAETEYFYKNFGKDFIKLTYSGKRASSTEIRVYSSLGLDISGMTEESVARYIREKGLYKGGKNEDYVKAVLPEKRLIHTADVAVCALKKAKELGVSPEKALAAAVLHDCAKYAAPEDYKDFCLPEGVPEPVVHSFLGAFIAENVLGVKDEEILDAVRYHTSGKADMSALGKLIFVADMIEKGRNYEGVEKLRALYEKDFSECFKECLKEEVLHLKNKKSYIYVETLNAYDCYVKD